MTRAYSQNPSIVLGWDSNHADPAKELNTSFGLENELTQIFVFADGLILPPSTYSPVLGLNHWDESSLEVSERFKVISPPVFKKTRYGPSLAEKT